MSSDKVDLSQIRGDWDFHSRYVTNAMEQTLKRVNKYWRELKKASRKKGQVPVEGELMEELKALASSLGLKRELVFTGFRSDVGAFYKAADLYVMCSIAEGLGTAVLDALALGKPVVATRAGGLPEIIEDGKTGRLVAPADPRALAEGIIELLTDSDLAKAMASAGPARVQQFFSIDAMVDKNIEVYKKILATEN